MIDLKKYITKRLISAALVLVGVSVLCFALIAVSGKDPAAAVAVSSGHSADSELAESLREQWGLNKPLYIRYFIWIRGIFTGELGASITTHNPISDDLSLYFPSTFALVGMGLLWLVVISFPVALLCVKFHGGAFDHITRVLTIAGVCLPVFWLGYMLLLFLAVKIPLFTVVPKAGIGGYILPSFALAFPSVCSTVRIIRASVLKEMNSDYAVYARTRGISKAGIILRHALKNALPPVITLLSQYLGYMLAGSAVVESVFSIKGIGSYLVSSVIGGDSAACASCIVIISAVFVLTNLAADIINRLLCPWVVREIND